MQAGCSRKLGRSENAAASSALTSSYVQPMGVLPAVPAAAAAAADIFLPTRPSYGRSAASNATVRLLKMTAGMFELLVSKTAFATGSNDQDVECTTKPPTTSSWMLVDLFF